MSPHLDQHYDSHILDKVESAAKGLTFARPVAMPPAHGAALHVPLTSEVPRACRQPGRALGGQHGRHLRAAMPTTAWPHGRLVAEACGSRPGLAH